MNRREPDQFRCMRISISTNSKICSRRRCSSPYLAAIRSVSEQYPPDNIPRTISPGVIPRTISPDNIPRIISPGLGDIDRVRVTPGGIVLGILSRDIVRGIVRGMLSGGNFHRTHPVPWYRAPHHYFSIRISMMKVKPFIVPQIRIQ